MRCNHTVRRLVYITYATPASRERDISTVTAVSAPSQRGERERDTTQQTETQQVWRRREREMGREEELNIRMSDTCTIGTINPYPLVGRMSVSVARGRTQKRTKRSAWGERKVCMWDRGLDM